MHIVITWIVAICQYIILSAVEPNCPTRPKILRPNMPSLNVFITSPEQSWHRFDNMDDASCNGAFTFANLHNLITFHNDVDTKLGLRSYLDSLTRVTIAGSAQSYAITTLSGFTIIYFMSDDNNLCTAETRSITRPNRVTSISIYGSATSLYSFTLM